MPMQPGSLGDMFGYPDLTAADEIDLQARKLRAYLLGDDTPSGYTPRVARVAASDLDRATWTACEPIHPVLIACRAWRHAIEKQDAHTAFLSAQRLQVLLKGMEHRPAIAMSLSKLHFDQPTSPENVAPVDAIAQFIAQSNA